MMKSERIATIINDKIKIRLKDHSKLLVAIDGYAGSGKTTVADFVAKQNSDVLIVHLDDFIKHWKERKKMMNQAKDKSKVFEYNWYRYDVLQKIIKQFMTKSHGRVMAKTYDFEKNDFGIEKTFDLSKKVLLIEGIFLLHPEHKISKLLDEGIYLDVDFNKADKKRVAREKKKWGEAYLPENHSDNWTKYFKKAYKRYVLMYRPQEKADLTIKV